MGYVRFKIVVKKDGEEEREICGAQLCDHDLETCIQTQRNIFENGEYRVLSIQRYNSCHCFNHAKGKWDEKCKTCLGTGWLPK